MSMGGPPDVPGGGAAPGDIDPGALRTANNLSELTGSAATVRTNLGLGSAATANKVAAGSAGVLDATDASTTNARTPTAHASSHAPIGGSDAVTDPMGWGLVYTLDPRLPLNSFSPVAANECYYSRCHGAASITKIQVNVGAASGNCAVAAYANTGTGRSAAPNTRRQTSGSVATPAIGDAQIALGGASAQVEGDWFGLAADNATATFIRIFNFGTTLITGVVASQSTAFPPPSPAVSAVAANAFGFGMVGV